MKNDILLVLSNNLKKQRLEKQISQEKLADLCNLHRTYIGAIERAERNITLKSLEAIANGLNIPFIDLLK